MACNNGGNKLKTYSTFWLQLSFFIVAFAVASAVMNRWIVTDVGLLSIGRIWQLFIDWQDYGFVRRGLVGTGLSSLGIRSFFSNDYHYALLIYHLAIFYLCALLFNFTYRNKVKNPIFLMTVAFSPALIFQLGYTTTSLDVFVVLFAALNMLFVKRVIVFCIFILFGLLTHELFAFTIPAQMLAMYIRLRGEGLMTPADAGRTVIFFPTLTTVAVAILITFYGRTELQQEAFEHLMADKMPDAARKMGLWSGYFEINSSSRENIDLSIIILRDSLRESATYLIVPIFYLSLLIVRLREVSQSLQEYLLIISVCLAPLCVTFIAFDHYRWIGLSCNLAIFFALILVRRQKKRGTGLDPLLVPFSLLGPLGSMPMDRPFPMFQFFLEKAYG